MCINMFSTIKPMLAGLLVTIWSLQSQFCENEEKQDMFCYCFCSCYCISLRFLHFKLDIYGVSELRIKYLGIFF